MDLPEHVEVDTPHDHDAEFRPNDDVRSDDVILCDDVDREEEEGVVDVGERDYSEGALCRAAGKGGVTLKGQINVGGQMEITHNNIQDNRTITKHVHHHQGDLHQHTHNQYIKEGDVVHHHGDLHMQTHHVHYSGDTEVGYAQIKDQSELALESDEKIFVETWAFRAALDQVSRSRLLVLTGPPSSGKTCVAHGLLRHYKTLGFTPLVLHRFEEWRAHVGGGRQQVVLLEDIFGKDQFQNASFFDWLHTFPTIRQLASSGKCVIIITVSDDVAGTIRRVHGSCSLLSYTLSLNSPEAWLSEDEKKNILEKHLKEAEKSISADLLQKVVHCESSPVLFSARCRVFAESSLDDTECLRVFTAANEQGFGICGMGPKVFLRIAPDIIKKSLLKPTEKFGYWGFTFGYVCNDVNKSFGDDDWTTISIQKFKNSSGTDMNIGNSSGDKESSASTLHESQQVACEADVQFEVACKTGDTRLVLEMLKYGIDLSVEPQSGFTALHVASLGGHVDIVKALLDHNFSVDATDKDRWTPLHVACFSGRTEIAELLIKHGAKLELDTCNGMRALHIACRYGHAELIELLLQNGALTEVRPITGFMAYPLHVAAFYGHAHVVKLLIKFNAQTDVRDRGDWLPLHYACQEGHLPVVELLVSNTAIPGHAGQNLQLQVYCHYGHTHLVKSLLSCGIGSHNPDGQTAVCQSCYLSNKLSLENLSRHHMYPGRPGRGNTTALFLAAQNGHYDVVNVLLKAGACTEVAMSGGWTPLLVASFKGHSHVVQLLLQYRTDMSASLDNVLVTALHLASANGHREVVDVLLEHGASPNVYDNHGVSPVHVACFKGQHNVLPSLLTRVKDLYADKASAKLLLSHASSSGSVDIVTSVLDCIPNIVTNAQDSSALHGACRTGSVEIVKTLLEHGFPNKSLLLEGEKKAPIHVASEYGHTAIVELLMSHGASVNLKTSQGGTALHHACRGNHVDTVRLLVEKGQADIRSIDGKGQTPLHIAANKGMDSTVKLLLARGADVNAQDSGGETPLFCGRTHSSVVDILLENKADASIPTSCGETVLHRVCTYGQEDTLRRLLHKVHLEAKDKNEETALFRACRAKKNRDSMITLLLETGANVEATDSKGRTPVQLACDVGDVDLLRLLLHLGGSVDSRSKEGETPLHQVCTQGHSHLIQILLQAGAHVNELSYGKNTPLHQACANLQPDCVRCLLEHGADTGIKNKEGLSAMNVIQSMNLSNRCSEEERRHKFDKKTEIMFVFIEFSQHSARRPEEAQESHDTVVDQCKTLLPSASSLDTDSNGSQERDITGNIVLSTVNTKTEEERHRERERKGISKDEDVIGPDVSRDDDTKSREGIMSANEGKELDNNKTSTVNSTPNQHTYSTDVKKRTTRDLRTNNIMSTRNKDPLVLQHHGNLDMFSKDKSKKLEAGPQTKGAMGRYVDVCSFQNDHATKESLSTEAKSSPLHGACFHGNTTVVLHHLLTVSDVDVVSESGRSALHYACAAGQHDIVALLLRHGANPSMKDGSGHTPLHVASVHGHLDTVDLLLTRGTDTNTKDKEERTALHLASFQGHGLIVAVLLANGSSINALDNQGQSALHVASSRGHALTIALLISHGAEVNTADHRGNTPLMLACTGSHCEVCVILLNSGAHLDGKNQLGETVSDIVRSRALPTLDKLIARHTLVTS